MTLYGCTGVSVAYVACCLRFNRVDVGIACDGTPPAGACSWGSDDPFFVFFLTSNRCYAAAAAAASVVLPLRTMTIVLLANAAMVMMVIQTAKVALVGVGLAFGSLQVSPAWRAV